MALLFSAPAGCPVPFAALNAAARSGGCFLVVSPDGGRAKSVAAALHAATKGGGLVLSSAVVARAAKRSGGGAGGQGEEKFGEDDDKATGMETFKKDGDFVFFGAGTGEDGTANVGYKEMTMDELAVMFHKETAMMLKGVTQFPPGRDGDNLSSLIASCNAIGDQLRDVDSSGDRTTVYHNLIALHLRIVSCAGGAKVRNPGSYLPDMWSGHRYRLPSMKKRAGTLMELLLLSRMLAGAALDKYVAAPEWDFTDMD